MENFILRKCKSNTTSVNSSAGDLSSENLVSFNKQISKF